jgi:hypothetical protein
MSTVSIGIIIYSCYLVASSAVNAMRPPVTPYGAYAWFYRFSKLVTANVTELVQLKYHMSLETPNEISATATPISTTTVAVQTSVNEPINPKENQKL